MAKSNPRRSAPKESAPAVPGSKRAPADRAAAAKLLEAARAGADVRGRKVRRIRAAIKVRAYENDLKLNVAVDRLLTQLEGGKPTPP